MSRCAVWGVADRRYSVCTKHMHAHMPRHASFIPCTHTAHKKGTSTHSTHAKQTRSGITRQPRSENERTCAVAAPTAREGRAAHNRKRRPTHLAAQRLGSRDERLRRSTGARGNTPRGARRPHGLLPALGAGQAWGCMRGWVGAQAPMETESRVWTIGKAPRTPQGNRRGGGGESPVTAQRGHTAGRGGVRARAREGGPRPSGPNPPGDDGGAPCGVAVGEPMRMVVICNEDLCQQCGETGGLVRDQNIHHPSHTHTRPLGILPRVPPTQMYSTHTPQPLTTTTHSRATPTHTLP
jgi:hypothetical protein